MSFTLLHTHMCVGIRIFVKTESRQFFEAVVTNFLWILNSTDIDGFSVHNIFRGINS